MILAVALSYVIDGVLLAGFAASGTVPFTVPLAYTAIGLFDSSVILARAPRDRSGTAQCALTRTLGPALPTQNRHRDRRDAQRRNWKSACTQRFPIDKLKIDRSFISDVASNSGDASIVRAIISLAHGLRLKAIARKASSSACARLDKRLN